MSRPLRDKIINSYNADNSPHSDFQLLALAIKQKAGEVVASESKPRKGFSPEINVKEELTPSSSLPGRSSNHQTHLRNTELIEIIIKRFWKTTPILFFAQNKAHADPQTSQRSAKMRMNQNVYKFLSRRTFTSLQPWISRTIFCKSIIKSTVALCPA